MFAPTFILIDYTITLHARYAAQWSLLRDLIEIGKMVTSVIRYYDN